VTKIDHVVEQRVSNLAQGLLTLGTMTGPLLVVIHLIPQGVLAGLFFVMGVQALEGNGITVKILFLCKDRSLTPPSEPLRRIRRRAAIWVFVVIQLLGFGATFAITQTIAAVGFPVFILALIPIRTFVLPKWFSDEELKLLDAPTASPFTMISVGGNYGESAENPNADDGVGQTSGEQTDVQSECEGVMAIVENSDEGNAELGQAPSKGMKGRESWRSGERSGLWAVEESFELNPGVSKRSVSRQSK